MSKFKFCKEEEEKCRLKYGYTIWKNRWKSYKNVNSDWYDAMGINGGGKTVYVEEKFNLRRDNAIIVETVGNIERGKIGWLFKYKDKTKIVFFNKNVTKAIYISVKDLKQLVIKNSRNLEHVQNTTDCDDSDGLKLYTSIYCVIPQSIHKQKYISLSNKEEK